MYYQSNTVSGKFRSFIQTQYPEAFKNAEYQTFLYWIMFQDLRSFTNPDRRDIYYKFVQNMLGENNNSFSVGRFLEFFEKDTGIILQTSDYKAKEKSRTVAPILNLEVLEAVSKEIATPARKKINRVYFVRGEKYTPRKQAARITEEHVRHYKKESSIIINYFANINPISYNPFYKNIDCLIEEVAANEGLTKGEKTNYLMALNALNDNLSPKYYQSTEYKRVFGQGYSLQNLKKDLRKDILKGTLEADLSSAQLTLFSYLFRVEEIKTLLKSGVNVWRHIHKELDISFSELTKACIKDAVYAATYGGGDKTIIKELIHLTDEQKDAFLNLEIIVALRTSQKQQLKIISDNKGAKSARDVWIPKINNPQSVLAQVMQSYELLIIEEVYKVATLYPLDFRILSHEHDGISFIILKDKDGRKELVVKRLERAVELKGLEIGVPITLELK